VGGSFFKKKKLIFLYKNIKNKLKKYYFNIDLKKKSK
jgi:hypothetical protein